jgi:hypothetical protein
MTGFARDISAGGIGLERVASMLPGEQVLVTLENGRSFGGLVAWGTEDSAGIRFATQLSAVDPLLMA